MLKHSLLITLRSFKKHKSNFLINVVGLSSGLACVLLIFLWVDDELKMDQFHEKSSQLYQVMEHQQYAEGIMTTTSTPGLLSETLKEEYPEVEKAATVTWITDYTLSIDDHSIKSRGWFVGKDFFEIFSFGLVQGSESEVLADKYNIVISEELAIKLFETTEGIIGKEVVFQHDESYLVSGVFKGSPRHSTYKFDFVLSYQRYMDDNDWLTSWQSNGPSTYIILSESADAQAFSEKIAQFIKPRNENTNVTLFLKKFSDRYLYGRYEDGVQAGGRIEYVRLFSIVAFFILIIACINFMNLSTARASRRAKEVGIKKAVGAFQSSLVVQFMMESLIISLFSLLIAFGLVWIFLPQFNNIADKQLIFELSGTSVMISFGIALLAGLLAGSYPAFYLSAYKPLAVLKGEIRGSMGELWARRGLVIFQFWLSVILIISVVVINRQIGYINSKSLGYNQENIVYFEKVGKLNDNLDAFIAELKQIPGVKQASSMGHTLMSRNNNTSGLNWEGKDPDQLTLFENIRIDYELIETLEIEMMEGRTFSREFGSDSSKIIFNKAAIDIMGLQDPIGKTITLWNQYELEIIGVTENFHFQSIHSEVKPLFFMLAPSDTWNVFVRIDGNDTPSILESISDKHAEFNPGFALDYSFMDQTYSSLYSAEQRIASLSESFAFVAILISCLGLFGLASFTAERRTKEIGIRKALGADISQIMILLTKDFTLLVGIAIVLAIPVSTYFLNLWLDRFAFKIDMEWWLFALAGILAIVIAWLTVGYQAFKAARLNPSDCLQNE